METGSRPQLRITSVTIGAPDPGALAEFYAQLLGGEVGVSEPGWTQVRTETLTLNVEHERHWVTPTWPAAADRQVATQHLDIRVDDLEAAEQWALDCGARLAPVQPQSDVRVLIDPVGHPFCLFR